MTEYEELPGDEEEYLWVVVSHVPQVNAAPVGSASPLEVGGSVQEDLTYLGLDGAGATTGLGLPVVPATALPSQSADREVRRTT